MRYEPKRSVHTDKHPTKKYEIVRDGKVVEKGLACTKCWQVLEREVIKDDSSE